MSPFFKKILIAVIGAIGSYYTTKTVNAALERKPLKTRIREGKEKVAGMKVAAQDRAAVLKDAASQKAADLKVSAQEKAEAAKLKANRLIEERDEPTVTVKDQHIVSDNATNPVNKDM